MDMEILVQLESVSAHHFSDGRNTQEEVCGPVHVCFWQTVDPEHKLDENEVSSLVV